MAIETRPEKAQHPGGGEPSGPRPGRPLAARGAVHGEQPAAATDHDPEASGTDT